MNRIEEEEEDNTDTSTVGTTGEDKTNIYRSMSIKTDLCRRLSLLYKSCPFFFVIGEHFDIYIYV